MFPALATVFLLGLVAPAEPAPKAGADPRIETESDASELKFTPGVAVWLRGQARVNPDFVRGGPDVVDALSRIRLQAGLSWRAWTVFAQAQDHRAWGSRTEPWSGEVGFHQGYLMLAGKGRHDTSGHVRIGRQEIAWGRHRLIGTFPWAPQGRSFDAVQLYGEIGWAGLELLYAMIERPRTFAAVDPRIDPANAVDIHTRGVHLGGARLALTPHRAFKAEVMALADFADASPTAVDRDRLLGDVGTRMWGEPWDGITYDVEVHAQVGRVSDLPHRAWAGASTLRAKAPIRPVSPGVQLGYAIASGHACNGVPGSPCAPSQSRDFFNFYPTNHPHYGILDRLGWSNVRDAEGGVFVTRGDAFELSAIYHFFQLYRAGGAWRDSGGNLLGVGWDPNESAITLGHEIDVQLTATLWSPLWLQPAYGVFLPAAAGSRLAGPDVQHFVFVWMILQLPAPG